LKTEELLTIFEQDEKTNLIVNHLENLIGNKIRLTGLTGSSKSILTASVYNRLSANHLIIMPDKESAAFFFNDLENIFDENDKNFHKKKILFYPASYKRTFDTENQDSTNILLRTEVMKRTGGSKRKSIMITYPEALTEKVVRKAYLSKNTIRLKRGESFSVDFIAELLIESDFEQVDFVYQPGQFSIRGGIIDVFSFTNDYPYRIEFFGDEVESIRSFNPTDQLSVDKLDHITIVPNVADRKIVEKRVSFLNFLIIINKPLMKSDINSIKLKFPFNIPCCKYIIENSI